MASMRVREAVGGGASLPLAMLNSNKQAVTLNLKTPRGVELMKAWRGGRTCCWKTSRPA